LPPARCSAPLTTVVRPAPHTAEWPPTLCDCLCVCGVWVVARGAGRDVQGGPVMPGGMLGSLAMPSCHPCRPAPSSRGTRRPSPPWRARPPLSAEWPPTICDCCLCACGAWVVARGAGRDVQGGAGDARGREGACWVARVGLGCHPLRRLPHAVLGAPCHRGGPRTRRSCRRLSVIACVYAVRGWLRGARGATSKAGPGVPGACLVGLVWDAFPTRCSVSAFSGQWATPFLWVLLLSSICR
jgi:hypothetical protein